MSEAQYVDRLRERSLASAWEDDMVASGAVEVHYSGYIPLPLPPQEKGRYDRALARAFWREGQHGGFW